MSIFDATNNRKNEVRVNKFDWSHANNFTTEIGRITPIFCELFPQKGSFRTEPVLGLQFMPMVFPIQTRMKARVSFFRYPLRALWKDYRDYVGNFRAGLVEPYHDFNGQTPQTGDLYDYLGLPTTLVGAYGSEFDRPFYYSKVGSYTCMPFSADMNLGGFQVGHSYHEYDVSFSGTSVPTDAKSYGITATINKGELIGGSLKIKGFPELDRSNFSFGLCLCKGSTILRYLLFNKNNGSLNSVSWADGILSITTDDLKAYDYDTILLVLSKQYLSLSGKGYIPSGSPWTIKGAFSGHDDVVSLDSSSSPYYDSTSSNKEKQIKISAYAARAYEGIYNAYFRDDRNNPYYVNGEVQYNKWIPTDEGGVDTTRYKLHYANWEKDFLTTAVQSPQQGVAPLVGITTYEDIVLNDDGTMTTQQRLALVDEDGRKFGLEFDSDADGLNDVRYTELSQGQVVKQPRSLYNLVQSGISINDIRNVNAYQKYLELNMRSGYSYKDIIQNRFNVKVRYSDLLMPEFIGGFTEDIEMHSITQNIETNDSGTYAGALGSQAGLAGCRRTGRPISCFCDEESIIIGVCVVTPVPVYTQLLPKHFTYRELLDHYQPEFNNIGFQPITYKEVCPVQAYNDKPESLNDTFGYQRPWYEFVQKYDVAHGLYRTQLRNFLMNRTFNVKPELSESFLIVDPEQVNDVFSVTETTDKIYGQIYFKCTVKLPISRVSIPRLD